MTPLEPRDSVSDSPPPRRAAVMAAISLLSDCDRAVAGACRRQLLQWGPRVREHLVEAAGSGDVHIARAARGLLRSLDLYAWRDAVQQFGQTLPRAGRMDWQTLEAGTLLVSSMGRLDPAERDGIARVLDGFADELRPRVEGKSAVTAARLLAGFLGGQVGYGGSRSSYYDVSNILFDRVVNLRRGVPVALALLYILVGRRAGLEVTGVAIPDHFLVRVHGPRPALIDPYHEGRQVTKADCIRYLRVAGYSLHTSSYLEDVADRQILDCLLHNLLRVYGYREDHEYCSVLETTRQALMQA